MKRNIIDIWMMRMKMMINPTTTSTHV